MDAKHIVRLGDRDYPTYPGVLAEAHERGFLHIETELVQIPSAQNDNTAIVKAKVRIILPEGGDLYCEDYGDASPRNTSARVAAALIRMASTRAKGRALRDAINVGQTMLEELPDLEEHGSGNGQASTRPKVRFEPGTPEGDAAMRGEPSRKREAAGPLFEEVYREGGKEYKRVDLIEACRRDQEEARALSIPFDALEADRATNAELYRFGRDLRPRIRAAKAMHESKQP